MDLSPELLLALLAHLPEGVLLLDLREEGPTVLYANGEAGGVVGPSPLAAVLGLAAEGPEMTALVEKLNAGSPVSVDVPHGDRVASLELLPLPPVADAPRRFIGLERSLAARATATDAAALPAALPVVLRDDRLTGLAHRDWFWELYRRDFDIAARETRPLAVFVADIDSLEAYNQTFGRSAGDSLIRLVGRALAAGLRRSGDLVAHDGAGRFLILTLGASAEQSERHAEGLAGRVRELHVHHPRSGVARFATVSLGVAHWDGRRPDGAPVSAQAVYAAALTALAGSRRAGRNRATVVRVALEN
jgi:diguanylate cyclase (GGDEF)-like protein